MKEQRSEPSRRVAAPHPPLLPSVAAAGNAAMGLIVQRKSTKALNEYVGNLNNRAFDRVIAYLNGLADDDIAQCLGVTPTEHLIELRSAAMEVTPPRWNAKVAHAVEDRIEAAPAPHDRRRAMIRQWHSAVKRRLWSAAIVTLNALNDADVRRLLRELHDPGAIMELSIAASTAIRGNSSRIIAALESANAYAARRGAAESGIDDLVTRRRWDDLAWLYVWGQEDYNDQAMVAMRVRLADMPAASEAVKVALAETPRFAVGFLGAPRGGAMTETFAQLLRLRAQHWPRNSAVAAMEHRFGHQLEGAWSKIVLLRVWDQLERLPTTAWSSGTILDLLKAVGGGGGTESEEGSIDLGQAEFDAARLSHTVRHEIAHAIHDRQKSLVDPWLQTVGFTERGSGDAGLMFLVDQFGGYPSQYVDPTGKTVPFGAPEKARVLALMRAHTAKKSSWKASAPLPAEEPTVVSGRAPTAAESDRAVWAAMDDRLKTTFLLSQEDWYENYQAFEPTPAGYVFWNHWYGNAQSMSARVRDTIPLTGEDYSAMSRFEFFANCYAEYFSNSAGAKDARLWGGRLPDDMKKWFQANLATPTAVSPRGGSTSVPRP